MKESDLIAALEQAIERGADPENAYSTGELAEIWNIHVKRTREVLKRLMEQGRVEVLRRKSTRLDGQAYEQPVYRIKT